MLIHPHLLDLQSFEFEICILQYAAYTLHQRIFPREAIPSHYFPLGEDSLGTTWERQPRSAGLQPSSSHSKHRRWKSMLIHQGLFTALYTQHLLDSQSFEFEICILQALNMPLMRCTNVFFQGSLSRHIMIRVYISPYTRSRNVSFSSSVLFSGVVSIH